MNTNQTQTKLSPELLQNWKKQVIKPDQVERYLRNGQSFIDTDGIWQTLRENNAPEKSRIRDILKKSLDVQTLSPEETASLLNTNDPDLIAEMENTAAAVKKKVYDNRIVTFAPLYASNYCVNNCLYCAFRCSNDNEIRRKLTTEEIIRETQILAGQIGHKRLIVVFGEHPETDADYIAHTLQTIYSVKTKTKNGTASIRRCNVNAAPMSIEKLKLLHETGIGTYQVFQETYHPKTYEQLHPQQSIKGDYLWRLYCMHRAMEAGIDDWGLGVLFGLYDWKFEVMGLLHHALDLEKHFDGIGPHTVSFPRLEPADNTPFNENPKYAVSDSDFRKLVTVIRLAIPYTGMIITARETEKLKREIIPLGCTQTDASTRIGVGAYAENYDTQQPNRQQFMLGDTRSLDTLIRELAQAGYITSFCTAGYRCGRTGQCIMQLLRKGHEGHFCKLNAILTFREWLDDFATEQTKTAGEKIIEKEIHEVKQKMPEYYKKLLENYEQIKNGKRDLYF
jgi:2-iminoacetate synthase